MKLENDKLSMSVLIVDDEPMNIQLLCNILKDEVADFEYATDGELALSWVETKRFDLILMDIMMPGLNGYEVCKKLKEDPRSADIPIIFLTHKVNTESIVRGFEVGAADYVTKPYSKAELLARVKTHLNNSYLQRKLQRNNEALEYQVKKRTAKLEERDKSYREFANIGSALTSEKNLDNLLKMIVDAARLLTHADGGTVYILEKDADSSESYLQFRIVQNETMNIFYGGEDEAKPQFSNIPLSISGKPNHNNVSSYVALTSKTVNIPDVYDVEGFDFSGTRSFDQSAGYQSQSMLVVPMMSEQGELAGVIQLINAQNPKTKEVIPFDKSHIHLISSLASQAAVTIFNRRINEDLVRLLNSFIESIATAIDEKSPYTGGHIRRVVKITTLIIDKINSTNEGHFQDLFFNKEEQEEIKMAAWMHDIGKMATPEYVVDKGTRLQSIYDRIDLIEIRFNYIKIALRNTLLEEKLKLMNGGDDQQLEELEEKYNQKIQVVERDLQFIRRTNTVGLVGDKEIDIVKKIAANSYWINDQEFPALTNLEVENLSIRKGTLSQEERKTVELHVALTWKILDNLPFPKNLARVKDYASMHHERMDGNGYHRGLSKDELPLQARIIAIADIFEALTARDRPYRQPMKLSKAISIMEDMKNENHINVELYDFFIKHNLHKIYAEKELNPDQID
ncbi:MAG: response regulator [Proteobacteria bacterium]|nr:response regulator [Pseudomonadota bacterium]